MLSSKDKICMLEQWDNYTVEQIKPEKYSWSYS